MAKAAPEVEATDQNTPGPSADVQADMPEKEYGPGSAMLQMMPLQTSANGQPPAAPSSGSIMRARAMSAGQRSLGNSRISRLVGQPVQAKLTVGAPNDPYEQEADRTADTVMRMPEPRPAVTNGVARQPEAAGGTGLCPECEKKLQRQVDEEKAAGSGPASLQRAISQVQLCPDCARTLQRQVDEAQPETEADMSSGEALSPATTDETVQRQPADEAPETTTEADTIEPAQGEEDNTIARQPEAAGGGSSDQPPAVDSDTESYLNTSSGGGQPLSESSRAFMEPRFGQDFSGVRVHTDSRSAGAAKGLNAQAFTRGQDIYFGEGRYQPSTPQGQRLLGHELTHTIQQGESSSTRASSQANQLPLPNEQRIVQRTQTINPSNVGPISSTSRGQVQRNGDESDEICEAPNIGTFVLDPALSEIETPESMTTHVRVQAPMTPGSDALQYQDRYIELEQPVRWAERIVVFAVPLEYVFETSMEASAPVCTDLSSRPLPVLQPGDQAWTASGPITVVNTWGNIVFTDEPNPETAGAGAVILLDTDAGSILIDAGLQLNDSTLAAPIGDEISGLVAGRMGSAPIGEAILASSAPSGAVLPYIASQIQILAIRATMDQYDDGSVGAILRVQSDYRQWYENALRDQLIANRSEWESTQPIAPNNSIREQRWNAYLETQMASAMIEYQPPLLRVAEEVGGTTLHMIDDTATPIQGTEPGAVPDLSQTQWEPDDDGQIIVYGNGRLALFPSRGLLLRPAGVSESRGPRAVSGLRPAGQMGPAPAGPQAVTPWMLLPTIGKEGRLLVRLGETHGVLVDAGGRPRVVRMEAFAEMARLGVTSIEAILPTHTHTDHVRRLIEHIKLHNIRAENLIIARSWRDTRVIADLRSTTDAKLVELGYGAQWREPGIAVAAEGVTRAQVRVGESVIDVYARGEAHQQLEAELTSSRRGGAAVDSSTVDSSSLLQVLGNESSSTRTAVVGDMRGDDIVEMHRTLGEDAFRSAFRNVRVIKGIGHHFSQTAGRTPSDIRGLNLLLEATLVQNGQLTILVQSWENFAFGGEATTTGSEGALLRYLVQQGVRVVFAGARGEAGGGAIISSSGDVATYGEGVQVLEGADPRVIEMYRRLDILREAHRTVTESPEFGLTALEMEGRNADQLKSELQTEIVRLEGLARELRGQAAADLLDARGVREGGRDWTRAGERQAFREANTIEGRTVEQILNDMSVRGTIERSLSGVVLERLRLAVLSGRSVAYDIEFSHMPRGVHEALEQLPEARRRSLAQKYREMARHTAGLEGDRISDAQHLEVLARASELRNELRLVLEGIAGEARATLEAELARLESLVEQLESQTLSEETIGRDVEGRRTRTEYRRMRQNELVGRGFHGIGRGLGALMVLHSVEQLGGIGQDVAVGDINIPEGALRVAHSAYGMNIGFRLARTTYRQALAGTGSHVRGWEFAIMAVLEIGAAAAADYESTEQRDAAIVGTAIHSSVNLLCLYAGQLIMSLSAKFLHHPIAKAAGMGLGLAVMMAGEKILGWIGLDDNVQRWTSFPPGEVTEVHQEIGAVLNEYKIMIGSQQLQQRSDTELTALGLRNPSDARRRARSAEDSAADDVRSKERELTGLFENAYRRARGSWVGLQMLDQQAAEFTRLRHTAMRDRSDPERTTLDQRWRQMDEQLGLHEADAATITSMEQWSELDGKLDELGVLFSVGDENVEFSEVFETMGELQMMIENARYRLDSASRGGYRPTALIRPGTEAYRLYTALLRTREERLSRYHLPLVRIGGGSYEGTLGFRQITPRAAYAQLRTVRQNYDARVASVAAAHPELARTEIWAEPAEFARAIETANHTHPHMFNQLRLTEMTLQSAARQASSALLLASSPPPTTLRRLIETEVTGVSRAIQVRRTERGLVFLHELDAILEQRGAAEDRIFAAVVDAAFPASRTSGPSADEPRPFTDTEIKALHSGSFKRGKRFSSTERQLAEHRRIMAPVRNIIDPNTGRLIPLTGNIIRDYSRMSRVVDRQYAILKSPYRTYDDGWIDTFPKHNYDPSLRPIVATTGASKMGANSIFGGPMLYYRVLAINADAVAVIGTGQPYIRKTDLVRATSDQIEQLARRETSNP